MSLRAVVCAAVLAAVGCSRSLEVPGAPGAPGPGTVSGRTVIALPGHLERQPAIDAEISVLGSGQRTRSDGSGNFLLEGLTESTGELLFRYDINRDGQWDRQRLLSIATLKAGPGRQVAVGDVLLVENARLHGKVLLEGAAAPAHAGTLAFVPEGPFTALSSDDGSFVFDALPDGELRLAFFRTGYLPDGFTELTLSGGQDLSLRDITLKPIPPGPVQPALLTGRVVLIPAGMVTQTLARLSEPGGMSVSAPVANDGTFQFMRLPGVYTLTLDTPGYLGARLPNLLLSPGETALGDVVLLQGVSGTGGGAGAGGGGVSGTGGGSGAGGGGASGTGSGGGSLGADSPVAVLAGATAVRLNDPAARIDGTRSYDPLDAGPLIFHWLEETDAGVTLSSNHSLLSGTPTFKAPAAPTTLRFALIVTSQGGRTSAPAHTQIEVVAPPIPVVMPPMLTMRPGTMAVFSAASSTDPASAPLTFRWFVLSGGITVSGTIGPTTNVTAPLGQGAAQLRLVVSNPGVSADPVDIPILIDAIGTTAAMVSVTPPQVVGFSDVVAVAAMASSTIPGEGFAYTWTRTQGPAVPLSGTNSQTLGFNAPPTSASFRFHVSVVGDAGSVGSAIAQVEVDDDVPPVLVASDPIDAAGSAGGWYSLTASFDEPLEPTTVSSANLHVRDGTLDLPVDVHYESAGNTVRVTPRRPLTPGQVYTFVIGALADTSARHNVFPGRSIAFNARSPRFTGWKRSASYSVKQGPGVVATSSQVWTLGVSVLGSPVWQMQRPNFLDGGVLDSQYFSANGGVSDAHRGQVANDVASWFFNGSTQGTYWYLASASWVIGSSGGPKATCSDGDRLAGLSENYGPHWGFIPAGGPLTETFYEDSRPLSYAGDSNDPGYACAVNGAHGLITVPLQTTRLLRVMATTGGAWQVLSTGLTGGVKFARAAYIGPSPLVCYAQATGVMSCSLWTGTAFVTGADLGPGTAGPLDLMSRNAGTAWLSYIAGNQVRLKSVWGQADAGSLDVTDWSGPMGTPSWNGDPSCTADTPELALAADALYLVWEESCAAGSFQLMLQKVD